MSEKERPPLTNRQEDLDWMRQVTHELNNRLDSDFPDGGGGMFDYFRHVLELIQLVEAQRDLLAVVRGLPS